MIYLEALFLTSRCSLFCLPWVAYTWSGMFNVALKLILSSLGSVYLEAEFLKSRFSLFCLPWVVYIWKRNAEHRFKAYSVFLGTHVQYCRTDTDRYLQLTVRKFRMDRHPCLQIVIYDSRSVCRGINLINSQYKYD